MSMKLSVTPTSLLCFSKGIANSTGSFAINGSLQSKILFVPSLTQL